MNHMRFAHRYLIVLFVCTLGLVEVQGQVRLNPMEAEKLIVEAPLPVYPPIAAAAHAKGIVEVEVVVSEQGNVVSAKAVSGHPLLQAAAVSAVRNRKYQPYTVGGNQVSFTTVVDVLFPPGVLSKELKEEYKRQERLANQYFQEKQKCRDLVEAQEPNNAEEICTGVVRIADQLESDRYIEKMGANELLGLVLLRKKLYPQSVESFNRALDAVRGQLTEKDAELGRLFGDLAIAHHLMRDLDKARELYKKAENIYQTAYATFGNGDSDEWVEQTKKQYLKSLKTLLNYHLLAAQDAGALSEVDEIKNLMKAVSAKLY